MIASKLNARALLSVAVALSALTCKSKPAPASNEAQPSPQPPAASNDAQPSSGDAACLTTAGEERPNVRWSSDARLTADLNYDGASDLVVWGTEGDSLFVVSIVECADRKPGRLWSIPLRARSVFGTLDVQVSLTDPSFGQGFLQENCMGAETTSECQHLASLNTRLEAAYRRGGRGLQIGVPDRHNLHVYWDSDSSRFIMWGL